MVSDPYGSFPYGWQSGNVGHYPDPWCDMASMAMPQTPAHALRWTEFIFLANGILRRALQRVVSYFITDVDVQGDIGEAEENQYKIFQHDKFGVQRILKVPACDYVTYGNSFSSVLRTFRRSLRCPKCKKAEFPFKVVKRTPVFGFSCSGHRFHARCPLC